MNTLRKLAATSLAIASIFTASAASADVVNFSGNEFNQVQMGTVHGGQTGALSDWYQEIGGGISQAEIFGKLPSHHSITFTFTSSGTPDDDVFGTYAKFETRYHYFTNFSGSKFKEGRSSIDTNGAVENYSFNDKVYVAGASLALASANLQDEYTQAIFTNNSDGIASFNIFAQGKIGTGVVNAVYAVSAVPLPAALPMFLSVLLGAFAYARRQKNTSRLANA